MNEVRCPTPAQSMLTRIAAAAINIWQSEKGVVAIQIAIMMPLLIGMGALAIDIGFVLDKQRQMQSAADAAAFSAAIAKSTGHPTPISTEAYGVAGQVGFVNGSNGVTVTVNNPPVNPPASAADAANPAAVQVIIQQPQTLPLVKAACSLIPGAGCSGTFNVGASAVATVGGSTPCAVQLSTSANPGIAISNGATITLDSCGLQVCSSGSTALSMTGGTQINLTDTSGNLSTKQTVSVAGTASLSNGAAINGASSCSSPSCKASQGICPANVNPYSGVTQPNPTGTILSPSITTTQTISAGQWTGGVTFGGGATITMNPGIYYVDQGTFTVGGGAKLVGTGGVTIVLTATGASYANVSIANGGAVTLTAPTTGATAGIAFFGDPVVSASNNGTETFTGGAVINVTGALYFPQQTVVFAGGVNNPSGCTQLIAGIINFSGGANFSNNCAGTGTSPIGGGGATTFVE